MSITEWQRLFKGMPNSKNYRKIFGCWPGGLPQIQLYYQHWIEHRNDAYFVDLMENFVNLSREIRFKMDTKIDKDTKFATKITVKDFEKAKEALIKADVPEKCYFLGNCITATAPVLSVPSKTWWGVPVPQQEKGNNPMRAEYNSISTNATVVAQKSDEAYQREYLLTQLTEMNRYSWREDGKYAELRKLFNIDAPTQPKSSKDLLDAFLNGKYTVDDKKLAKAQKYADGQRDFDDDYDDTGDYYSVFYGITFTDLPVEDRKGYDAAVKAYEKASKDTERKIIVGTPAEGLDALIALEAWLPTGKAN